MLRIVKWIYQPTLTNFTPDESMLLVILTQSDTLSYS